MEAVDRALGELGGISKFIKPGEKVLVKPNLLSPTSPDNAITTHPSLVEAVVRQIQSVGAHPIISDSPGAGMKHSEANLRRLFEVTGMMEVAERTGAEVRVELEPKHTSFLEGRLVRGFELLPLAREVDAIVNLPKLKTHVFMTYTGAVKNLFGLIYGVAKTGYHVRFSDEPQFAAMLIDIMRFAKPRLTVMDGVIGLEGNGPGSHGSPKEVGVILAGGNPVEVDAVACRIVGIDLSEVPIFKAAKEAGIWDGEEPQVVGIPIEEARISDFRKPDSYPTEKIFLRSKLVRKMFAKLFREITSPRPVPRKGRCIACGVCVRSCPQDAIKIRRGLATVNDSICIRCYCCHEMCPESAIELQFSTLSKLFKAIGVR
jgi:uncharacterized protein (DUF362 family)/NAD-dependent dihydropyrimidine dehydrogenase PreA subunit